MGAIEDTRKIIQELVAPDLKAIQAQLTGLEKHQEIRFAAADGRVAALEGRFESLDLHLEALANRVSSLDSRIHSLDSRFQSLESKMDANQQVVHAQFKALDYKMDVLLQALSLDKRLERLERERVAPQPLSAAV